MEQNNILINKEYKDLKCSLYNHLLLFIVNGILNIIFFVKTYFFNIIYKVFFMMFTIIFIMLIVIPIYPLILLYKKQLSSIKVKLLKKTSLINSIITIIVGILINIILILNIFEIFRFYKECPYNFSYNDIAKIFHINSKEKGNIDSKNSLKCSDNRCLLIEDNSERSESLSYLCNFDSSFDFESLKNKITHKISGNNNNNEIICSLFEEKDFENEDYFPHKNQEKFYIIQSYFNICSIENNFYRCIRFESPKVYKIDNNISCPNIYDNIINLIFGLISIIFNFLFPLIVTIMQFIKYRNLLKLYENINDERASTRGTTKNNSQIQRSSVVNNNDNTENNNNNNYEILIIENNNRKEEINQHNNNMINNAELLNINKKSDKIVEDSEENINSERKNINYIVTENINSEKADNDNDRNNHDKNNNNKNNIKKDVDTISNNSVLFRKINLMKNIDDEEKK